MKRFTEIFFGAVTLIVIFFFFLNRCNKKETEFRYITKTDTVRDLRVITDTFRTFIYRTETVPVPIDVDTFQILQSFFEKHYYTDTLKNDTDAFIRVDELVTMNRISERQLTFINRRPTSITTTTIQPIETEIRELYIGAGLMFQGKTFDPGFRVGIQNKKISYDLNYFPLSHTVMTGFNYNFKLKQRK